MEQMNLRNLDKNDSSEGGKQEVNNDKSTESEEEYRPKTAAMPDLEVYSSKGIRKWLDIGELLEELQESAWEMLEQHEKAFGFDGQLGNHPTKA